MHDDSLDDSVASEPPQEPQLQGPLPLEVSVAEALPRDDAPERDVPEYEVIKGGSQKGGDLLVENGR